MRFCVSAQLPIQLRAGLSCAEDGGQDRSGCCTIQRYPGEATVAIASAAQLLFICACKHEPSRTAVSGVRQHEVAVAAHLCWMVLWFIVMLMAAVVVPLTTVLHGT